MNHALIPIACLVLTCSMATASPVYKWQDKDGVTHYSSKPTAQDAQPAKLPEITRAEVKISTEGLQTCNKHGGVNCQLGPDSDGSVVCYDGFKGAVTRYRFNCNSPKLKISDVAERDENGGFTVYVRNSASVAASQAAVLYKPSENSREIKLAGPIEIEPFGLGEYKYTPGAGDAGMPKPSLSELNIECANCSG